MNARLITTAELNCMVNACVGANVFTIHRDADTCRIIHTETNEPVLEALSKGPQGPWIARTHPELFIVP